jgi:hypothetical protein
LEHNVRAGGALATLVRLYHHIRKANQVFDYEIAAMALEIECEKNPG